MQYERCTLKKLQSIFEFLDTDHDGSINVKDLEFGLTQLDSTFNYDYGLTDDEATLAEYSASEILRSIPTV